MLVVSIFGEITGMQKEPNTARIMHLWTSHSGPRLSDDALSGMRSTEVGQLELNSAARLTTSFVLVNVVLEGWSTRGLRIDVSMNGNGNANTVNTG